MRFTKWLFSGRGFSTAVYKHFSYVASIAALPDTCASTRESLCKHKSDDSVAKQGRGNIVSVDEIPSKIDLILQCRLSLVIITFCWSAWTTSMRNSRCAFTFHAKRDRRISIVMYFPIARTLLRKNKRSRKMDRLGRQSSVSLNTTWLPADKMRYLHNCPARKRRLKNRTLFSRFSN